MAVTIVSTDETSEEIRPPIEWNAYLACAYAEGFNEGEGASEQDQLQAWAYLIGTGLCWSLQGWYGRSATDLIQNGYISKEGKILIDL